MIEHYSNSSTTTFRRCTFRFNDMYMGERKEYVPNSGQRMGKAGHMALKAYYLGHGYKVALDWAYQEFAPASSEDAANYDRLKDILMFYWASTLHDGWEVVEVEKEVKIGQYMGIVDLLVVNKQGERMIVDHKFQKDKRIRYAGTDTQISFYLLLARELGWNVSSLLYNVIPTADKPEHPVRKLCYRSTVYLDNFKVELDRQIVAMQAFQLDPKPYRNYTEECSWGCPIYQKCTEGMELRV